MRSVMHAALVAAGVPALIGVGAASADALITGRGVKNGSLTSADLRDGSLTGRDIRNGTIRTRDLQVGRGR